MGTRRALNLIEGANIGLTVADDAGNDRVNVTVALASVPAHNHAASDINSDRGLARGQGRDLSATVPAPQAGRRRSAVTWPRSWLRISRRTTPRTSTPGRWPWRAAARARTSPATGPGFLKQAGVGAAVTVAALASGDLPAHTHTSAQISDATAAATASTVVLRDGSAGANFAYVAANNLWAYLDSHLQSVECGRVRNGRRRVREHGEVLRGLHRRHLGQERLRPARSRANAAAAPDGNTTADQITASTATPIIQQQVAGLVDGGTYTFYVWAKVASGTKLVSIAIVNNAYGAYLAGPTQITLTTAWQRFRVTGTLAGGQTGLWIVVRQYAGNGDNWTSGDILLWGACLQQGNDPKKGYARTWAFQTGPVRPASRAARPSSPRRTTRNRRSKCAALALTSRTTRSWRSRRAAN